MFNVLRRKLKTTFGKNKDMKVSHERFDEGESDNATERHLITRSLAKNKKTMQEVFSDWGDIEFREFELGTAPPVKLMIIYIKGLTSMPDVHGSILEKLMLLEGLMEEVASNGNLHLIKNKLLPIAEVIEQNDFITITNQVLTGDVVLFIDGEESALMLGAKGWSDRAVGEPPSEPTVRGPRDGFTENILVNVAHIRRRVRSSRLKLEKMNIGLLTKTDVVIMYIDGIVNDSVVVEVRNRLKKIKTDAILESGYIEEFIQDEWLTPFPLILSTERPDRVAAHLLEGHVAVLVDTTPFALIMPTTFFHFLTAAEDYYTRAPIATAIRLLRLVAINIALLLPSVYIAIATFHQEMLPTQLLISIAQAREGVPFPAFVEAFIMESTFELLREAGVRLPRPVGQAVSIVGALVIGQAAVSAGLVSPAMVIVVALTAISSFAIPNYSGAIALRLMRFPLMVLAATLGLFGIMSGLMAMLIHLSSLRSFGVPYIAPISPLVISDWKDFILRAPHWAMFTRPRLVGFKEPQRQEKGRVPKPPKGSQ